MKVQPRARLIGVELVVLPTPPPLPASFVAASARQVSSTGPPRPGGPLFLKTCSLLI